LEVSRLHPILLTVSFQWIRETISEFWDVEDFHKKNLRIGFINLENGVKSIVDWDYLERPEGALFKKVPRSRFYPNG